MTKQNKYTLINTLAIALLYRLFTLNRDALMFAVADKRAINNIFISTHCFKNE